MVYKRLKNESYDNWVKRLLTDYKNYGLTKQEVYKILFDIELSENESRKRLYGVNDYIDNKDDSMSVDDEVSSKIETKLNSDGSQSDERLVQAISESEMKDANFLLVAHGYDPAHWELSNARSSMWEQKENKLLYSSRITVKPKFNPATQLNIDEIFENINVPISVESRKKTEGDLMLEVNLRDIHMGKLSWQGETGENYDYKIAMERVLSVVDELKDRVKDKSFEKVILCMSDDFFHFDDTEGSTTKGTKLDTDLRWTKMFLKGTELIIRVINKLKEIAPVEYVYIPGNHDFQVSFYASCVLYEHFAQNDNVEIDISPKTRKYIRYGNSLIGFAHGNEEKKRIDGIMQVEAKEDWGETDFREWHLGHLHSHHLREVAGIKIRNISSTCGTDSWHSKSGFVGSLKMSQNFIWHKEYGLLTIENIPVI